MKKQDILCNKKMIAIQTEYTNNLGSCQMFHSAACWRTKSDANTKYELLTSREAKMNATKEQIHICVAGFGWKDLHHHGPRMEKSFLLMTCLSI